MSDRAAITDHAFAETVGPPDLATTPPLACNRCGFPVRSRPWGCKHPCQNCGTVYPLGDCSD